ncbi:hypothetical protein [Rubrimonas cliftonensis]|uniref:Uncharacterized protein n=1 Tax=Rubrimonas cliftonensis TaxID=89524 RepID=A0A1H4FXN5_9RHOB|nr:hypothetical protein [Rubrimonas cliftonensis]SEB02119.1 hypothetical protein SAMN05444370_1317 [Rubrimonas cliftonensis]
MTSALDRDKREDTARAELVADLHALLVAHAQAGVGLSLEEWRVVLNAHAGAFSVRRAWFRETTERQLARMAGGIFDDDPARNGPLANKIAALPLPQRIAVLDTVDRYWLGRTWHLVSAEDLADFGVVFAESGHEKIRAARARGTGAPGR